MADIKVSREHGVTLELAKGVMESVAEELAKEHGIHWAWQDEHALTFGRTGIEGFCHVTAEVIEINVKLALLMRPVRSVLENAVNRRLDNEIGKLTS